MRQNPRPLSPEATRAMNALRRIVRALQSGSRTAHGRRGVSGAQQFVLSQLADEPGLSLKDLAERTLSRPSTVSEVVGRLTAAGLVRREHSRADARRLVLTLTARGAAVVASGGQSVPQRLVAGLARLTATERAELARALEAWVAAAGLSRITPTMLLEPAEKKSARHGASEQRAARRS